MVVDRIDLSEVRLEAQRFAASASVPGELFGNPPERGDE